MSSVLPKFMLVWINLFRCIRMSLVHDMGESIIGDITPHCGVAENTKYDMEVGAMDHIASLLNGSKGQELRDLFQVKFEN